MHPIIKPWLFREWGLDIIGKIHPPSSKGHRFVLVAMNYFTKWTAVVPLKNMAHKEIIEFITKHIIHRLVARAEGWWSGLFEGSSSEDVDAQYSLLVEDEQYVLLCWINNIFWYIIIYVLLYIYALNVLLCLKCVLLFICFVVYG
jgi:hypothetical protein